MFSVLSSIRRTILYAILQAYRDSKLFSYCWTLHSTDLPANKHPVSPANGHAQCPTQQVAYFATKQRPNVFPIYNSIECAISATNIAAVNSAVAPAIVSTISAAIQQS